MREKPPGPRRPSRTRPGCAGGAGRRSLTAASARASLIRGRNCGDRRGAPRPRRNGACVGCGSWILNYHHAAAPPGCRIHAAGTRTGSFAIPGFELADPGKVPRTGSAATRGSEGARNARPAPSRRHPYPGAVTDLSPAAPLSARFIPSPPPSRTTVPSTGVEAYSRTPPRSLPPPPLRPPPLRACLDGGTSPGSGGGRGCPGGNSAARGDPAIARARPRRDAGCQGDGGPPKPTAGQRQAYTMPTPSLHQTNGESRAKAGRKPLPAGCPGGRDRHEKRRHSPPSRPVPTRRQRSGPRFGARSPVGRKRWNPRFLASQIARADRRSPAPALRRAAPGAMS